jgi:hypothetical protein
MEQTSPISQYELLKIILSFIGTIIWPVTAFIIVLIYREAILKLINRAKKVELPGGLSLETVGEEIKQAKELAEEVKLERKPEIQEYIKKGGLKLETQSNKRMIELGLTPSPSGLNLDYYKTIADSDPRLALAGLRIDLELMIRNLANGFGIQIEQKEPNSKIISKLFQANKISSQQYEFINSVFKIANTAAHGAFFTKEQVYEVLDIGQVLVDDYVAWLDWGFRK